MIFEFLYIYIYIYELLQVERYSRYRLMEDKNSSLVDNTWKDIFQRETYSVLLKSHCPTSITDFFFFFSSLERVKIVISSSLSLFVATVSFVGKICSRRVKMEILVKAFDLLDRRYRFIYRWNVPLKRGP